ncbi:MAG: hypothetical protein ACFFA8_14200 [Promethearchaeota archaeon]
MFFNNDSHIIIDFEPISRRVAMEDLGKNLYQILVYLKYQLQSFFSKGDITQGEFDKIKNL